MADVSEVQMKVMLVVVTNDVETSDQISQPYAGLNLRNLKWVSKLDKSTGKYGFTEQPRINITVKDVNDLLQLFELFVTD
jgi:hypothetical protein